MENLADELQAIAEGPESDPAEDFRVAGQRLVDALRDQFADGQVEALYSLQTAAAQVKKHGESMTSASSALLDALKAGSGDIASASTIGSQRLAEAVAESTGSIERSVAGAVASVDHAVHEVVARTTTEVSETLRQLLSDTHASIGEQLAAEVDASSTELRGAAHDHAQSVASQLEVTSNHLSSLYEGVLARTDNARQGLEWVAQQGAEQLTAAVSALQQHRAETEAAIAASGQALTERVREAGAAAQRDLAAAAESAGTLLRETLEGLLSHAAAARRELDDVLIEARKAAEDELVALRKQIQAAERREEAVAERLQQHVEDLVSRTDATVAVSLNHLRGVADALLERDAQLEKRRVDEFARVLQTVLTEGGASTRRLRDRIFRGMETAKTTPPVLPGPAPAAPPARVTPPTAPAEPVTQPTLDVPVVPKVAAKNVAAKKPPAKKAALQKPRPPKGSPDPLPTKGSEPPGTDLPDATPVPEEQA